MSGQAQSTHQRDGGVSRGSDVLDRDADFVFQLFEDSVQNRDLRLFVLSGAQHAVLGSTPHVETLVLFESSAEVGACRNIDYFLPFEFFDQLRLDQVVFYSVAQGASDWSDEHTGEDQAEGEHHVSLALPPGVDVSVFGESDGMESAETDLLYPDVFFGEVVDPLGFDPRLVAVRADAEHAVSVGPESVEQAVGCRETSLLVTNAPCLLPK